MFKALFLSKQDDDTLSADVREIGVEDLPEGKVLVSVLCSSLNYKDGLAITGKGNIIRGDFPFIPGIDLVGRVEASETAAFKPGDMVVQTGGGLGETRWGGYSQQQRVDTDWLVKLPRDLSPEQAMTIGTAGFTAMLSVMALEKQGLEKKRGEVLVTGASGGVGSMAVAILAHLGYSVAAATGSEDAHEYLRSLGADRIIGRDALAGGPKRPMESARWAGAVDTVGGDTLATVIAQMGRHGSMAACGNAGGFKLDTTVFPFILRGVNLLGIDSNTSSLEQRSAAWERLVSDLPKGALAQIQETVISLDELPAQSEKIVSGRIRGRVVVDVQR